MTCRPSIVSAAGRRGVPEPADDRPSPIIVMPDIAMSCVSGAVCGSEGEAGIAIPGMSMPSIDCAKAAPGASAHRAAPIIYLYILKLLSRWAWGATEDPPRVRPCAAEADRSRGDDRAGSIPAGRP